MPNRLSQLTSWLQAQEILRQRDQTSPAEFTLTAVAGDASFRRYFRLTCVTPTAQSYIAMDAPPEHEDCLPFVNITKAWLAEGIPLPKLHAEDLQNGFLLLEDFGDDQFFNAVETKQKTEQKARYTQAIAELSTIQNLPAPEHSLPPYNRALLDRELRLFSDWLIGKALNVELTQNEEALIEQSFQLLIDNALKQTKVAVHRDYHSRNLMIKPDNTIGIIDFQDAVYGPCTYDLVSLLRDCYIRLDKDLVTELALEFKKRSAIPALRTLDDTSFLKQFDLMGIQRHMKAAGIFARLSLRDGKHGYLQDIPRTFQYILDACDHHPELGDLAKLLRDKVEQAMLGYVAQHRDSEV